MRALLDKARALLAGRREQIWMGPDLPNGEKLKGLTTREASRRMIAYHFSPERTKEALENAERWASHGDMMLRRKVELQQAQIVGMIHALQVAHETARFIMAEPSLLEDIARHPEVGHYVADQIERTREVTKAILELADSMQRKDPPTDG